MMFVVPRRRPRDANITSVQAQYAMHKDEAPEHLFMLVVPGFPLQMWQHCSRKAAWFQQRRRAASGSRTTGYKQIMALLSLVTHALDLAHNSCTQSSCGEAQLPGMGVKPHVKPCAIWEPSQHKRKAQRMFDVPFNRISCDVQHAGVGQPEALAHGQSVNIMLKNL